jgi:thiol-disulfide isomerase/thioredoxin
MKKILRNFIKRHHRGILLLGVVLALAIVSGASPSSPLCTFMSAGLRSVMPSAQAADVPSSSIAPAWTLKDVDGKTVKSSDFAGKVVILDFWATWCPPCKAEIPGFIELQKKYGNKGLVVVGVSLDEAGPTAVKPFMKQLGMNYHVLMADEKVVRDFGSFEGIPRTFVIDRKGDIVGGHTGYGSKEDFEKEIAPLF